MPESDRAPLIGAVDLTTPLWVADHYQAGQAGLLASARAAPRTMATAVRWAWRTSPALTLLTAVVELVSGLVTAFGLLATASVFTQLLQEGPTPERLIAAVPAIAAVVGAAVARELLRTGAGAISGMLSPKVGQQAQDQIHAAMLGVELVAFEDADFAELVERASMMGPARLQSALGQTSGLISAGITTAASVATAGVLHPLLVPVVLLAAIPQAWATVRTSRLQYGSLVRTSSRMRRSGVISRLVTGRQAAAEIRAFTTQDVLLTEQRRIATELTAESISVGRRRMTISLVGRGLSGIGTGVAYLVLGLLLYLGMLPLALAGAAAVAMRAAAGAVLSGLSTFSQLYESSVGVDLFHRCIADALARRRAAPTAELPGDPTVIRLEGVSFRYPGQDERALDGIDAVLRRGQVTALVGENGSGKSTLAKLITGLYLPQEGSVMWDGVDTARAGERPLHSRVAVVLQEPLRWPMTAENNVRVGRLEADDAEGTRLDTAAARSGADGVVADLPQGWATMLSREFQGGRDLSGGQWQRISVARGLYREAPLVIADEPTAALDARAERAVFESLRTLGGEQRITVLVTHRLANVRHADQILVLEHGKLTEHGTHDELMARDGTYHELFSIQADAYA